MFQSNDQNMNDKWQSLAREGSVVQAVMTYRSIAGTTFTEAKRAVSGWIASQPAGVCKPPIEMSDHEAVELTLDLASTGAGYEVDEDRRRACKAIDIATTITKRILERDANADTGPVPPGRHVGFTGHHWLRNNFGELVVRQWQPGVKKWCASGMVATMSSVDTTGWTYVAPCPMPLEENEQIYLEGLHEEMRRDHQWSLTERASQFLREFLYGFRRTNR